MTEIPTSTPEDNNKDKKIGYYLLGNFVITQARLLEREPSEK